MIKDHAAVHTRCIQHKPLRSDALGPFYGILGWRLGHGAAAASHMTSAFAAVAGCSTSFRSGQRTQAVSAATWLSPAAAAARESPLT